jgi:hypothetical protein
MKIESSEPPGRILFLIFLRERAARRVGSERHCGIVTDVRRCPPSMCEKVARCRVFQSGAEQSTGFSFSGAAKETQPSEDGTWTNRKLAFVR